MIPAIKAEFRKLLTVRSTYLLTLLALIMVGIFSLYGEGFKDSAHLKPLGANLFIAGTITQMASFVGLFGAIIALLSITYEYRHNTITYTLTASNSRTKVLAAKFISTLIFVLGYSVLLTLFGLGMIFLGLAFSHNLLPHQDINYLTYISKSAAYAGGFSMAGLLFGVLIRHQVGSLAALFILPNTLEGLLSLLLKHDSVYMPFIALAQVVQAPTVPGVKDQIADTGYLSPLKGLVVFLIYFFVGWAIAWYLFLRRDAT